MTVSFVSHHLEDVFTYPFSDPKSPKKLLIAALLALGNFVIPILPGLILEGYMLEIRRRFVIKGNLELPEWTNWGRYLSNGANAFVIGLIFLLPVLFLALVGFMVVLIPGALLDSHAISRYGNTPWIVLVSGVLSLAGLALLGIMILLGIAAGLVLPAAVTHFIVKERFSAAFNISEWWAIFRHNFADFLIAYILLIIISILSILIVQMLSLTIVLCFLVPLAGCVIAVYSLFISTGLFGRAYLGGLEMHTEMKMASDVEAA